MTRLVTSGFESQILSTSAATSGEGENSAAGGTAPVINTSTVRSGAASLACAVNNNIYRFQPSPVSVLDRTYYLRTYVQFSALPPSNNCGFMRTRDTVGGFDLGHVRLTTGSTLELLDSAAAVVGVASPVVSAGVWYRVELEVMVPTAGAGTIGFRLDGVEIARSTSADVNNTIPNAVDFGAFTTPGITIFHDDIAINDNQGASQNSFPGPGKIVMLKPISDNARVGFVDGIGGTTGLFGAVDNRPPIGVVTTSATASSQIESPTNNATDTYDANLGAYTTAVGSGGGGLTASDSVTVAQAIARGGNSTTTARNLAVQSLSNPVIAEATLASAAATGTEPIGWKTLRSLVSYNPGPTLGTSPVVRIRKGTASTDVMQYDLMGLYVEYVPSLGTARRKRRSPAHRSAAPTGGTF